MADSRTPVTVEDIDALVTGATPQFSQQIRERLSALVRDVPAGTAVREYADAQLAVLDALAFGTTRGLSRTGTTPSAEDAGWDSIPSHPNAGHART